MVVENISSADLLELLYYLYSGIISPSIQKYLRGTNPLYLRLAILSFFFFFFVDERSLCPVPEPVSVSVTVYVSCVDMCICLSCSCI